MRKSAVLSLYGGALNAAKRLKITHQAVYKWPDELPRSAERAVRKDLADFLKEAGIAR
jgi:hypothetical protein